MAKSTTPANWQTIDPTTLPVPIVKQYERYKEAYREMKAERKAFEDALSALAPASPGKRIAFGYNYGKLSIAVVDDDAKPAPAKGALSLGDFLKSQHALGKRT